MLPHKLFRLALAASLAALLPLFAQETPPTNLTPADVQAAIAHIEVSATLDAAAKAAAAEQCTRALELLRQADERAAAAARFRQDTADAGDLTLDLQEKLSKPAESPDMKIPADATATQVAQLAAQTQAELDAIRKHISDLDSETVNRGTSRVDLPAAIAAAETRLAEYAAQLAAPPPEGAAAEMEEARKALLEASVMAATAELDSYRAELENYDTRSSLGLPQLLRDDANREASRMETTLASLQQEVVSRRAGEAQEAESETREVQAEIEGAHLLVRGFAEATAQAALEYAKRRTGPEGLTVKLEAAQQESTRLDETLRGLDENVEGIENRVEALGLNDAVGVLLRKERGSIPDVRASLQRLSARQREYGDVQRESIDLADRRDDLADVDRIVDRESDGLAAQASEAELAQNKDLLRRLLAKERSNLDGLIRDFDDYGKALLGLNVTEEQIVRRSREFQEFIDERVLWIRSGSVFGVRNLVECAEPLGELSDSAKWVDAGAASWAHMLQFPLPSILLATVFTVLLLGQRGLRRELLAVNEQAAKPTCVTYRETARAFAITAVISGTAAGLLGGLAWQLTAALEPTHFGRGAAAGLLAAGGMLFPLAFLRQTSRPRGLGEVHFGWAPAPLAGLRRHLRRFLFVCLPAAFAIAVVEWHGEESWNESLGRTVFLVLMASLAGLFHALLRPSGPMAALVDISAAPGRAAAFRWARRALLLVPMTFFVQAFAGYYYTAVHLSWRLYLTLSLGMALALLRGMIVRWLLITRRRLTIEQMRLRREARRAREADMDVAVPEEPMVDLKTISQQSHSLLGSALMLAFLIGNWLIWKSVLPALGALDDIAVFTDLVNDVKVVTSLADCFLAAIIALMTWAAVRNLPAIIEIVLLQRFKVAAGERYAISAITRYTITVIGVAAVANALGIGWDKVQWLVAALSLGLGFGLQEIFANFVSGLIILFERPVRVGDAVTIGNVSGTVSKIRIRATTIVDWDRKELIVPNKEFVTGQVLNWSLSDSISRLVVRVGIAYGSDTQKAMELMYTVAREHSLVLEDPEPKVWFIGFGANSLDFELHVYSPNIEANMPIQHDIHVGIDRAFREAKIEIAFPQRDLHIRSVDPSVPIYLPEMDIPRDLKD